MPDLLARRSCAASAAVVPRLGLTSNRVASAFLFGEAGCRQERVICPDSGVRFQPYPEKRRNQIGSAWLREDASQAKAGRPALAIRYGGEMFAARKPFGPRFVS